MYQKGGIEKKMRKLLRSKKALSPVVAAIILIAVTVAVSIAVATWMGALTFTFMKVEKLEVQGHVWDPYPSATTIMITVINTGTAPLTISKVRVNGAEHTKTTGSLGTNPSLWNATSDNYDVAVGATKDVWISRPSGSSTFISGVLYQFEIVTTTNYICPYSKTAP